MYYTVQAANNKGADQTVQMCRLIHAFVVRTWQNYVVSRRGSIRTEETSSIMLITHEIQCKFHMNGPNGLFL